MTDLRCLRDMRMEIANLRVSVNHLEQEAEDGESLSYEELRFSTACAGRIHHHLNRMLSKRERRMVDEKDGDE